MSQQPIPAAEPHWLAEARRRDGAKPAAFARAAQDRRALLKAYDEMAARATQAESRADELAAQASQWREELAEQEKEKLVLVQELQAHEAWHRTRMAASEDQAREDVDSESFMNGVLWYVGYSPCNNNPPELGSPDAAWPENELVAAPTPPPSSPAAAGAGMLSQLFAGSRSLTGEEAQILNDLVNDEVLRAPAPDWYPKEVFDSAAAYDASVKSVTDRIASGEIQPREPDEVEKASLWPCPTCGSQAWTGIMKWGGATECSDCPSDIAPFTAKEAKPAAELRAPTTTEEGKEGLKS